MTLLVRKNQNESFLVLKRKKCPLLLPEPGHTSLYFHVALSVHNLSDKREGKLVFCICFSEKQLVSELTIGLTLFISASFPKTSKEQTSLGRRQHSKKKIKCLKKNYRMEPKDGHC